MTEFQIALVMFSIGWCLCGIFIALLNLCKMNKKLDEILKVVKQLYYDSSSGL